MEAVAHPSGGFSRYGALNRMESPRVMDRTNNPWRAIIMPTTHTNRGRAQDRARVAGGQDHEVKYEAGKTGASKADVRDAVKSAGNSRKAVEKKLKD